MMCAMWSRVAVVAAVALLSGAAAQGASSCGSVEHLAADDLRDGA
jgi:hypothetical protein